MFVSLSAAPVQACGFGEEKERWTALWRCRRTGMEERQDKGEERRRGRRISAEETINRDEVKSSCQGKEDCII